ncbi:MAG: hypothetical protein COA50_05855 [Flavobacteriaceae bacterium]|nr:MAG: hypothetical protein COA50_05855 [Flavobacteriaceae bacterium]
MEIKPNNLFAYLSNLETELSSFSFDELTLNEATELKESYQIFKNDLEKKFFGEKSDLGKKKIATSATENDVNVSETMLIAKVSHEIRTPLNGIVGFADLLKESELTSTQTDHVNAIQSASHTLMRIINELLEYSKLSTGLSHFESIDFDFHKLVNDVTYLCKTLIVNKDVELIVKMDKAIPKALVGDPSKLSQVLLNLIGNAIKFVEKGSIQVQITMVGLTNDEIQLEFDVTDTGIGMSENSLEHIFESFKQAEPDTYSKYGGTGLGLNIVKQIIEKLDGEISVSSSLGKGSTFKFTLPYKKGTEVSLLNGIDKNNNHEELVKGMQILVFEDNTLNQRLIEQRLKKWKCNVFITDKIIYGLNVLKNNRIDVVLMDLKMPEMDGYAVTEKIRSSKDLSISQVPIIALTADFNIKDKEKCNTYGINDFILKPYNTDELLDKLIRNSNYTNGSNSNIPVPVRIPLIETTKEEKPKVNLDNVYTECMEEMEILQELVGLFTQNALEFIGKVKIGIVDEDFNAIKFSAHKIKAGLKMMETFGLCTIVEEIHSNCETTQNIKVIENLYHDFLNEYPKVEKAIGSEVERLKKK